MNEGITGEGYGYNPRSKKIALKEIEKFRIPNLFHFEISEKKVVELCEKLNAKNQLL